MWVAFDETSEVMQKNIIVKHDNDEMLCILLYVNQTQMPNWYSNCLLSIKGRTLLGNVLLVIRDQEWPKQLAVSPEHVALWMQLGEDGAEGSLRNTAE
jgi:hypothetical protein